MPNPEWGVKRTCQTCGGRFYDLMRDPIVCPSCGAAFDIASIAKPKRGKPAAKAAAVIDDEDEDLIDEDEDALDEDEDEDLDLDAEEADDLVIDDEDADDDAKPAAAAAADDDEEIEADALEADDEDEFAADVLLEDEEDADDLPLDDVKPKGGGDE